MTKAPVPRRDDGPGQEAQLRDIVGVSLEFYARIERGKTLPSVPTLLRLAAALRASADVLLGLDRLSDAARARVTAPDPPVVVANRWVMRRIRQARPSTMRLVALLFREVEAASRKTRRGEARLAPNASS